MDPETFSPTPSSPRNSNAQDPGNLDNGRKGRVFFKKNIYLFIWLCQVLAAAYGIFDLHWGMPNSLVVACET